MLMLVEFQPSNGQVFSIVTRHASAVFAGRLLRSRFERTCREREAT